MAGCVLGRGLGAKAAGIATAVVGGGGAFAGAAVGCFTGGVSLALDALPLTTAGMLADIGRSSASPIYQAYKQEQAAIAACSSIP